MQQKTYPDASGSGIHSYDAAGRLAAITDAISAIAHNARGQATSVVYANGATATYSCDTARGWMDNAASAMAGITHLNQAYGRDAKGRITGVSDAANPSRNWTYGYDTMIPMARVRRRRAASFMMAKTAQPRSPPMVS